MLNRISLTVAAIIATACAGTNSKTSDKESEEIDERQLVGIFQIKEPSNSSEGLSCQGFISGKSSVTTALHCVQDDPFDFERYAFYIDDKRIEFIDVELVDDKKDLVSYRTAVQFADHLRPGYFDGSEYRVITAEKEKTQVQTCSRIETLEDFGALKHNCDLKKGTSGAPILNDTGVVGVHLGQKEDARYALDYTLLAVDESDVTKIGYIGDWPHVRVPSPHIRPPHIRGSKTVTVCGVSFGVSALVYYACKLSLAGLPASCTAGAAATAGTACYANITAAAGTCGVSVATMTKAANACIDQATGG